MAPFASDTKADVFGLCPVFSLAYLAIRQTFNNTKIENEVDFQKLLQTKYADPVLNVRYAFAEVFLIEAFAVSTSCCCSFLIFSYAFLAQQKQTFDSAVLNATCARRHDAAL